jgi:membrane associated rhomboid family serine protease
VFPIRDNIPTERLPLVTIALIAINCIVYFFLQPKSGIDLSGGSLDQRDLSNYAAIPWEITHWGKHCVYDGSTPPYGIRCGIPDGSQEPTLLTLFTSMFTHGGLLHLGGNMLFLWIFGNNVEDAMGPVKFIVFYLVGGLAALALQTAIDPNSQVPTLGASGAIAAVLGGYIRLYPRARVLTVIFIILFFTIVEIPAIAVLGFWFVEQVLFAAYGLSDPTGGAGGVAYFAHIGGFVFGLLTIKLFANRVNPAYGPGGPRHPVY